MLLVEVLRCIVNLRSPFKNLHDLGSQIYIQLYLSGLSNQGKTPFTSITSLLIRIRIYNLSMKYF